MRSAMSMIGKTTSTKTTRTRGALCFVLTVRR